jgi:hypothetical protein
LALKIRKPDQSLVRHVIKLERVTRDSSVVVMTRRMVVMVMMCLMDLGLGSLGLGDKQRGTQGRQREKEHEFFHNLNMHDDI